MQRKHGEINICFAKGDRMKRKKGRKNKEKWMRKKDWLFAKQREKDK